MSTKIYNGFRVKTQTLDEAFRAINTRENRKTVAELFDEAVLKYTSHRIARVLDRAALYPDDAKIVEEARYPMMRAHHELRDQQKEIASSGRRNPLVDFEMEASLIPVTDGVIGILYIEQDSFRTWFMGLPCVEDFSYWDNTDRPDNLTAAQWTERERIWDEALPGVTTPAEVGVTLQLSPSPDNAVLSHPAEAYIPYFKPREQRARAHAIDYITSMKMRSLDAEGGPDEDISQWSARFWEADRYVRSNEGAEAVAKLAAQYEPRLPDLTSPDYLRSKD